MLYFKPRSPMPPAPELHPTVGLHYFDSAEMLLRMQAEGCTRADMARLTGLTVQQVVDRLRLCAMEESLRGYLRRENVPERTALALLMLPDALTRRRIACRIVRERLCIRDAALLVLAARRRCGAMRSAQPQGQRVITLIRDIRPYHNAIRDIAGQMQAAGVRASFTERRSGSLMELTVSYPARRRRALRHQSM